MTAERTVTAGGARRITRVRFTDLYPRWVGVSQETVGGPGAEDLVIELAEDGMNLMVLFRDGTSSTWHRCVRGLN